jgi:hypothetical protein
MRDLQEARSATASVPGTRWTFGKRLVAAARAAFGHVDVDYIRARVDHWTTRDADNSYGMFASFKEPGRYHVVREGNRVVVTPPKSGGASWAFSPGWASWTVTHLFERQPNVTNFAVDEVWISHYVWKNGKGATDVLQIRGLRYGSHTVAALDYDLVHKRMRFAGRGFGWNVWPTLDGPGDNGGIPQVISETPDPTLVAPVAPIVLALTRVIADTTGCQVSTHVEFIGQPRYNDGDAGD